MSTLKKYSFSVAKLLFFWILVFEFQRILFSIHHWEEFSLVSFSEWLLTFVYSFRLDLTTAVFLSVVPLLCLSVFYSKPSKFFYRCFFGAMFFESIVVAFIHAGEINAYSEWKHKLTARVFMHLSNPDEVFRTSDGTMALWFSVYAILEIVFAWRILRWLHKLDLHDSDFKVNVSVWKRMGLVFSGLIVSLGCFFVLARGGFQQIPINIDSAYFSSNYAVNDLSVNSAYFFGNSYVLYTTRDIEGILPEIDPARAEQLVNELYDYPKEHNIRVLNNKRPNIVMVVMESWAAEAIGVLSNTKGNTPNFDGFAKEGILFTNFYAAGGTSEIGNTSIFSGNPPLPELSISTQPEKHRKLASLNEDLREWGYTSHYIFSGDLKYGNLEGYLMDHGFDDVKDEGDFPKSLPRGKLNYFDEDLYSLFLKRINNTKGKFLHCAFTGSTHFPFDHPNRPNQNATGKEAAYVNSIIYADECLGDFIEKCKKEDWFDETLFIFIADHSRHTPAPLDLYDNAFYRIPLLLWGEPLKDEFRGTKIEKVGSQYDFVATLLGQMEGDLSRYQWSKDLLNPNCSEFAFHTVTGGFGWIVPSGAFTYHLTNKKIKKSTFSPKEEVLEKEKSDAFLHSVYSTFKEL